MIQDEHDIHLVHPVQNPVNPVPTTFRVQPDPILQAWPRLHTCFA